MKKLFSAIILIGLCAIFAFSQIEPASANWQFFAPEKEEFTIEFPISPATERYAKNDFARRYYSNLNGTYFFIASDQTKNSPQYDFVMKFVNSFSAAAENGKSGKTATQKFVFTDGENYHHTVITAQTKTRVYVFQTISPTENDPLADRFFANLKITEKPLEKEAKIAQIVPNSGGGISGNNETGSGAKSGNGSGSGERMAAVPPPQRINAGVNILSKPRALYTDLARFYEVSGSSSLRVTFRADGQIGEITVVSKLPMGLTANAVKAAKNIRFEPAVRDGQPITVVKMVQYSFAIY